MRPSQRSHVAPFYVMEVMKAAAAREAEGDDVLHLEVGQPMTSAPAGARAAARAALDGHRLGYTHAVGIDDLRMRIARFYAERYGVVIPAERIAVTIGASGGMILALLAACDAGARVGITEPGYAAYRNMITALDLDVVGVPIGPGTRWVATPEVVEHVGPLDAFIVASPSNPTGTTMTRSELAAIATFCRHRGIRLISDEIYHGITYEEPAHSMLELSDEAVVVQSFSKYQSMTGWRLGWLVLPADLVRPVEVLSQNLFISPPTVSQLAGLAAFECHDELQANVAQYAVRRSIVVAGLADAGITKIAPPDGAFYVWADVGHLCEDSQDLCARWLDELAIAVTPGIDFDPSRGRRFVRFSYSESTEDVSEAMRRLVRWAQGR